VKKILSPVKKIGEQSDQLTSSKTLYDVSWRELVLRNLIAGISRAFGGLLFNVIILLILGSILFTAVWPQAQSFFNSLMNASKTMSQFSQTFNQFNNFPTN